MKTLLAVPLLVAAATFAGCLDDDAGRPDPQPDPQPAALPDPLVPGSLAVTDSAYDFGFTILTDPTLQPYQYPSTVSGSLHYPTEGEGPFPLVLLMHGRHGTCAVLGTEILGTHACPDAVVVTPVNSYTGYAELARNLASHGYVVASVNANHVNDRDLTGDAGANARAQLLLYTLEQFASVNATGGPAAGAIRAVFALAPTDFARWPAPGVPFATLLPYCDGDVFNLQGAWIYDDARGLEGGPRYQVLALGANHNFYNTVWTGDDWGPSGDWCGSAEASTGRDTPESQRAHGYGLMASFFRLHVGGEDAFAPMWDGDVPMPASLCPGWDGCAGRLLLSRHAKAEDRLVLSADGAADLLAGGFTNTCSGAQCFPSMYSVAEATPYLWNGTLTLRFPVDAPAGLGTFSFRVAVPPGEGPLPLKVRFIAEDGASEVPLAGHAALATPPMGGDAKGILSMVGVPVPTGMGSEALTAVELWSEPSTSQRSLYLAYVLLQR